MTARVAKSLLNIWCIDIKKCIYTLGCGEVVNTADFDSAIHWFKSNHLSHYSADALNNKIYK